LQHRFKREGDLASRDGRKTKEEVVNLYRWLWNKQVVGSGINE